ncbi:MAG: E3 binding domain-containing protein, partial [Sediminibacterium sp.]|nr:E3 binding domain-containing protein [Sediminibacterium sp.]
MAIAELVMPKLGESIMEATILKWYKNVGDHIKLDETVLDIATDKVDSEVPSTAEGVLTEILFNVNDVVPIGTVIARINTDGASAAAVPAATAQPAPAPVAETPVQSAAPAPVVLAATPTPTPAPAPPPPAAPVVEEAIPYVPAAPAVELMAKPAANRFYSPLVLNIANSEGIGLSELERIPGTGSDGRVSKRDILQYVADKKAGRVPAMPQPAQQPVYAPAPQPAPQPAAPVAAPVAATPVPAQPVEASRPEPIAPVERFAAPVPTPAVPAPAAAAPAPAAAPVATTAPAAASFAAPASTTIAAS